jgi:MFS transporter, DHA1 family, tetracycline resistance protein
VTIEPRKGAITFIMVTIFIDVLTFGLIIPVWPILIKGFAYQSTAEATRIGMWFGFAWAIMQFFFAPILGCLSDQIGRRPVILFSNIGNAIDLALMAIAPSLAWLFVGRILSGITAASFSTATAYIADVTPQEKRSAAFGMIGAAWGIGFVVGPVIGGLLGELGPRAPFWAAAGLSMANFLYGLFILPESLPREKRQKFSFARANPLGAFKFLKTHPGLLTLAAVYFLSNLGHHVYNTVYVFYVDYRYHWSSLMIGGTLAIVGLCSATVQGVFVKRIVGKLGERRALFIGLMVGAFGMTLYGFASQGWMFVAVIPVIALWGIAGPSLQTLATSRVEESAQGELQGAFSGLMSISSIFGPLIFGGLFSWTVDNKATFHIPGAPFFLSSIMLASAAFIAWRSLQATQLQEQAA